MEKEEGADSKVETCTREQTMRTVLGEPEASDILITYLALNWTAEKWKFSLLGSVLSTRRATRVSRPGLRGVGLRGKACGDQEQWSFPNIKNIKFEDWEKRTILKLSNLEHQNILKAFKIKNCCNIYSVIFGLLGPLGASWELSGPIFGQFAEFGRNFPNLGPL